MVQEKQIGEALGPAARGQAEGAENERQLLADSAGRALQFGFHAELLSD
jgi:hypothetical protein